MIVSLIDYGLGNIGSVSNMLKHVGAEVKLVSRPEDVVASDRVLLPGVGAFDEGVRRLEERGLIEPLRTFAETGRPLFGICLGMQLLLDRSDEGKSNGLGLVPGHSERFTDQPGLRIPHMGWNTISKQRNDPLLSGLSTESRFYFVHSYRVILDRQEDELATTDYPNPFTSMIRSANVIGAQFHPEKSHDFGMTIFRNFLAL
ncbi:MAG: imidazole glycerol phosphate synthase subunit HisH [Cryobacterium sp.]|nr:imidazole glycerol phosphate synthase subunit HisH [Cryobacterium sp.]